MASSSRGGNFVAGLSAAMLAYLLVGLAETAVGQTSSPADGPWSGSARCQVTVQGPGYSHQETHTWTLTGGAPTIQGAMRVFAGSWSVTGGGSLTRTVGAQTLNAQWTTNASLSNAPIAVFVRASDNRLIIKSWHSQLRVHGGVTGTQQVTISGVPQTPGALSLEAFEWLFPAVDDVSTSQNISHSSSTATNGSVGPMQPGGSQGTANCTWNFGRGAGAPTGGGQSPPGTQPGTGPGTQPGTGPGTPGTGTPSSGGNTSGTGSSASASLVQVSPLPGWQSAPKLSVTLTGQATHFVQGTTQVNFGPGVTIESVSVSSPTSVVAVIDIDVSAAPGARDVTVTTGSEVVTLSGGYNIVQPSLALVPSVGQQGQQGLQVAIVGGGPYSPTFQSGAVAIFGGGITVASTNVVTPVKAIATINIDANAQLGPRTVQVNHSPNWGAEVVNGFVVTAATSSPGISSSGGGSSPPPASPRQDFSINCSGPNGLSFDGSNIWVMCSGSGNVMKLQASDGSVLGSFDMGGKYPTAAVVVNSSLWIGLTDFSGKSWATKLDLQGNNLATLQLPSPAQPTALVYGYGLVWILHSDATIDRLDPSGTLGSEFTVGQAPAGQGFSARGMAVDGSHWLWIVDEGGNKLAKLNPGGVNSGNYAVGKAPQGLVLDGTNIWVANSGDGTVSKVSPTGQILQTVATGQMPWEVAFDGTNVWVTNSGDNTVSKIRANDGVVLATYPAAAAPRGIVYDGTHIWVANAGANSVSRF